MYLYIPTGMGHNVTIIIKEKQVMYLRGSNEIKGWGMRRILKRKGEIYFNYFLIKKKTVLKNELIYIKLPI